LALLVPPSAGLALRYRVGSVSGLTSGGAISSIPDTSGKGHPAAAQVTGSKQPVARQYTVGSKTFWAADFDGTDDVLTMSGTALGVSNNVDRVTIVVVAAAEVTTAALRYAVAISNGSSTTAMRAHFASSSAVANAARAGGRRLDGDTLQTLSTADGAMDLNWHGWIARHLYEPSDLHIDRDGTRLVSTTSFKTNGNTSATNALGAAIGGSPNNSAYWNGSIA